ncbi:hydrolase or metal-binding protein [Acinetobacter baumannii]|uniref:recombination directionality factor n=1 Tax=Acinetobacter baumannii TaxID=470 RepID=UPI001A90CEC7|nr:hydrolase or metal-binding protein [Acinetobacter baumannii]EKV3806316.1 hydrolase or metal-binding protein [Acinetobacter baumannii]EKW1172673.1 hydrolase or metal-binding protein [Acinetobacter baumannii]MBO0634491.1 hydrolase or metal-binding protein [Acinetobacter baumannii]MBZ0347685.1 hydrolase or metal-binding protein [Acinetobacter baumannii]MBZ0364976.1 hydrolase or metal-binding protein [Acinetobacter baumannii]
MIKGLAITPPILGRISIGKVIEKNGKRLPEKDDQFTITSQIQGKDGWVKHPLDETLRTKSSNNKLRSIPVRMIFNDPELNLRAEYTLFDRQTGRPICIGNGETCQRSGQQGIEQHPCSSPSLCPLAQGGLCKPYGRLYVNLDDADEFGTFIFRTTGFNSIRTLAARLAYYHAASGKLLSCLPLQLTLRGKSTTQSYRTPIYYVDLTLRDGMSLQEAITMAKQIDEQSRQAGFYQEALDEVARQGYANAKFEVESEEGLDVVEEFYHSDEQEQQSQTEVVHTDVRTLQKGLAQSVRAVN